LACAYANAGGVDEVWTGAAGVFGVFAGANRRAGGARDFLSAVPRVAMFVNWEVLECRFQFRCLRFWCRYAGGDRGERSGATTFPLVRLSLNTLRRCSLLLLHRRATYSGASVFGVWWRAVAQIVWSLTGLSNFSPEERECAVQGGVWDRTTSTCSFAQPLPPSDPLAPDVASLGSVDPDQMFADGFVYVAGKWVRFDSPEARGVVGAVIGGGAPRSASVIPTAFSGGSVLGFEVPAAPSVVLPSFVGGALGNVRMGGGLRPASGGTPVRVRMGLAFLPVVRMGSENWGR